jgi:RNA-directed DNA polymerase
LKLHDYITDKKIINYVWQFLNRTVEWGGLYHDIKRGIPRGASLSPLLGAFYLLDLDREMEKLEVKYIRYMDDILILAPTRWKLRKAIRVLNKTFNKLGLEQHPDKTLIGRTERGFDFLGYFLKPGILSVAKKTIKQFKTRIARLYEQGAGIHRIRDYVKKWLQWVNGLGADKKISTYQYMFLFTYAP